MEMEQVARWAYTIFVVLAIVAGLAVGYMAWNGNAIADINGWVILVMLILGIIIGLTSITTKEVTPFLIASIALIVAASYDVWSGLAVIHDLLYALAFYVTRYIVAFAAPAAILIAMKSVLAMAKEK